MDNPWCLIGMQRMMERQEFGYLILEEKIGELNIHKFRFRVWFSESLQLDEVIICLWNMQTH